jgi:hypothetical protein
MLLTRIAFLAAVIAATMQASSANDSAAEIALGGLVLTPSEEIALESEDLFVSREQVRVSYRFRNTTDRDIDLLIAFPLPDLPTGGASESDTGITENWLSTLAFQTRVEGKQVKLSYSEAAIFDNQDITKRLKSYGIPVFATSDAFHASINGLPAKTRTALSDEGLIETNGTGKDITYWKANWSVRASVTRRQNFPAGKTIAVEHSYQPAAGGSLGGSLEPQARTENNVPTPYFTEMRAKYCIDNDWLASFDRIGQRKQTESWSYPYIETWLGYVLKSGANWKGPIKDFRLVVDKGKPESMVSFCGTGVKKISPTRFEVRYKDFEPKEDLNILIINWGPDP